MLYPLAFGCLIGGMAVIFREMFALLGQDSQYQVDEVAEEEVVEDRPKSSAAGITATPHAA